MARAKSTDNGDATAAESGGAGGREGLSKSAAVRAALSRLGKKAMPKAIQDFVKSEYGLEMSVNHISNIKSTIKKKGRGGKGGKRGRRPKAEAETATASTSTPAQARGGAGGLDVGDVETVKALTQRVGAADLHALVDLLAK